jgi:chaperone modulatory protein CbpM
MKIEVADARWLCEHPEVSLEELVELSGLPGELLLELVEYGALVPLESGATARAELRTEVRSTQLRFTADCVTAVRTVSRLRADFDLDANALSVAMMLIERIHGLEVQLREVRSHVSKLK